MAEFLTYTSCYTEEEVTQLTGMLSSASIPYRVEHEREILDKIYVGETLDPLLAVKIPADSFQQANELIKADAKSQVDTLAKDYYLFQFTDEELINVVRHPEEWNAFDQGIAEKLLENKGVDYAVINETPSIASFKPIRLKPDIILLEYVAAVFFVLPGILIGLATLFAYKTLPDGRKVKMYDRHTRDHGTFIIVVALAQLMISIFGWLG